MLDTVPLEPYEQPARSPERFLVSDLCSELETYLEPEQVAEVYRAYLFGAQAHEGQHRLSGEPYIYHPLAVARILGQMRMDHKSIVAAILHDVIEDTPTLKEHLDEAFGTEVAELVDGVSKLTQIDFKSRAEAQAENFRKMLLAMVRDIRVIMIKLADRLHNMRTLGVMPANKRRRIARETLDIYAPIAKRLGIHSLANELEDLGFRALYPGRYKALDNACRRIIGHRREATGHYEEAIRARLDEVGIKARILGRQKHLFSVYRKMRDKRQTFQEITDVLAFRIVVDSLDTCYRVLGAIHNLYKPVPGKFKDYIAIPKANGYQSLHTTVIAQRGVPLEIQIRTEEMDRFAESGIAAHWLYKDKEDKDSSAQTRALEWLKGLLEMQQNSGSSLEFLESVKVDLFPDEVYVFTPSGDIMKLPRGSTVVDFAYAVHTDVGNHCVAAKIDHRLAPLSTPIGSGQTVEVITAPGARPHPSWLDFVATGRARSAIRNYLKKLQGAEAVELGRRMLDRSLSGLKTSLDELSPDRIAQVLAEMGYERIEQLLEAIGLGNRVPSLVAHTLVPDAPPSRLRRFIGMLKQETRPIAIKGTEGMVVSYAKCCHPLPGDPIIGFMTSGKGLVIHRERCRNVRVLQSRPDRQLVVQWAEDVTGEFQAKIRLRVKNERGVLAQLAATIADMGSNIEDVGFEDRDGTATTADFVLSVRDRAHLARIMRRLRRIPVVMRIRRVRG
jgi:guanosine-3',5'-bis(diphosphate) 3'-pyrophosphohydrolase